MDKYDIHFGAKPEILEKAKELKKNETEAEKILWKHIRNRGLNGLKFRRQHPIDCFIADFYCHELRLVIEIDGGIHDLPENKKYDIGRTHELEKFGIKVIRFKNEEILNNIQKVKEKILNVENKAS